MPSDARPYVDRQEAGRALVGRLAGYADRRDVAVLALPRGGVPVAVPVAQALGAPLDVVVVRKLGLPGQPELAMGAIAGVGGDVEIVHNQRVLTEARVSEEDFDAVYRTELEELRRRENAYRDDRPAIAVRDRVVILVDDGVATGSTVLAAITAIRHQRPARVVVAVPIGSARACTALEREADEVICVRTPSPFYGVGQGYRDFSPTQDDEVRIALARVADSTTDSTGTSPR
ncbi:MAG: phosphoribosyltransferase [Actinobacteria bacterium]|nr:phosphoribosyltransferase [Actinomycetota bacterium]